MKKAISVLMCLLFALTVLYPAGVIITGFIGYRFELISVPAFSVALTALFLCTIFLDLICKNTLENEVLRILLAIITPLSLINAAFYIFACPQIEVIASASVSAVCCFYLTVKHGKPISIKIVTLVLSSLMILPMTFLTFMFLIFGNIGQNTVVQTVESPSGEFYAQVIDSDQGALGGDTLVVVYQESSINLFLIKIEKKPQRVYLGQWGEFRTMQIYWKDDHCLLINSTEYKIE